MTQGELEFETTHTRASDPETSRDAARRMAPHVWPLCQAAAELVRAHPGMTGEELDREYRRLNPDAPPGRLRKRLKDTADFGLIRRGLERACGVTGGQAVTWYAVEGKS